MVSCSKKNVGKVGKTSIFAPVGGWGGCGLCCSISCEGVFRVVFWRYRGLV